MHILINMNCYNAIKLNEINNIYGWWLFLLTKQYNLLYDLVLTQTLWNSFGITRTKVADDVFVQVLDLQLHLLLVS